LQPSYWQEGFFNVPLEFSTKLGAHGETIVLYLENPTGGQITTSINRSCNQNKTVRILKRTALRDWFKRNFKTGEVVQVGIIDKNTLVVTR